MSSNDTYEKYTNWRTSNKPYVIAAVAAIIVFMLVAPITQKGDGMAPTIGDGDIVVLKKDTFSENRGYPEYEDIIVFKTDYYESKTKNENRVSRVIGLPGDTIEVKDGDVYRNNKKLEHKSYEKGKIKEDQAPVKVSKNKVYILCDNRSESMDSRNEEVGVRSLKDVRGKALIVLWPFSNFGVVE